MVDEIENKQGLQENYLREFLQFQPSLAGLEELWKFQNHQVSIGRTWSERC